MKQKEQEKNLVYVFAKEEFRRKSSYEILRFIETKNHPDYKTIYIVKQVLEKFDVEVIFIGWEDIHKIDTRRTKLLIIPQEMMIGGKLQNTESFIEELYKAQKNNSDIILLHHHPYVLKDFINIKTIYEQGFDKGYFGGKVMDVKIKYGEEQFTKGIKEVLKLYPTYTDEFTYKEKKGSNFKSIIEKVSSNDIAGKKNDSNYILFGYNKSNNNSYTFLIDVHATGAKRGPNGRLFQLLLENTINFILGEKSSTKLNEEEIINQINLSNLNKTEKKQLIDSRIGQGIFRQKLIDYWGACSVTGFKNKKLLKASHIKPWKMSSNKERLDLFNGLLLLPNLDTAFDQGLITFDNKGRIILSSKLCEDDFDLLGIKKEMKIRINKEHWKYMKFHNDVVFNVEIRGK